MGIMKNYEQAANDFSRYIVALVKRERKKHKKHVGESKLQCFEG